MITRQPRARSLLRGGGGGVRVIAAECAEVWREEDSPFFFQLWRFETERHLSTEHHTTNDEQNNHTPTSTGEGVLPTPGGRRGHPPPFFSHTLAAGAAQVSMLNSKGNLKPFSIQHFNYFKPIAFQNLHGSYSSCMRGAKFSDAPPSGGVVFFACERGRRRTDVVMSCERIFTPRFEGSFR